MRTRAVGSNVTSAPSGDEQHRGDTYYAWGVCGFLVVAIGLIYGQTLDHALFDYDDSLFVYANPHVTAGLTGEGIRWAFTDGPAGEWYPLAMLSHMLDCQLFGLNAWGHHLTNVLLHAAASIALFLVLRRMTDELWPSAFVATVFAVHPQHVESVAWVAERRDVLSGLFFMLTLGAYLGYVRHGRSLGRYLLVAALFALGLMAKPMLVTLPPLLVLLDFWPLARFGSAADTPRWTQSVERPGLRASGAGKATPVGTRGGRLPDDLADARARAMCRSPWSERIGNAAVSCVTYVVQFFYPVDLVAFYPTPLGGPPTWKVAGGNRDSGRRQRGRGDLAAQMSLLLCRLVLVFGHVDSGAGTGPSFRSHDGRSLHVSARHWALHRAGLGGCTARRRLARAALGLGTCAGLAIAVLVAAATWQTSFWRDDETLWRHALACTTDNGKAEFGVADALARKGQLDEAIPYYRRAEEHPIDSAPFNNLGVVFARQGKLDEAIDQFRRALEIEPNSFAARVNLGLALVQQNRFDESMEHFRRALEIDPLSVKAHCGLAHVQLLKGRIDDARGEFEQAIAIDPRNAVAQDDLASTLLRQGKLDASIRHCEAALAIDPKFFRADINLGAGACCPWANRRGEGPLPPGFEN